MSASRGVERDREGVGGRGGRYRGRKRRRDRQTGTDGRETEAEQAGEAGGATGSQWGREGGKRERGRERDGEGKQRFKHLQTSIIVKFNDPTLLDKMSTIVMFLGFFFNLFYSYLRSFLFKMRCFAVTAPSGGEIENNTLLIHVPLRCVLMTGVHGEI